MKQWRIEVFNRSGFVDVHGNSIAEEIKELFDLNDIKNVRSLWPSDVFNMLKTLAKLEKQKFP